MADLKMQSSDLLTLAAQVESVYEQDVRVGTVLQTIVEQLAHAHGLDLTQEQDKARIEAQRTQDVQAAQDATRSDSSQGAAPAAPTQSDKGAK